MALKLSRLFQKTTYLSLSKQNGKFVFSIRYGDKEESLEAAVERWPELEPLERWIQDKYTSQSVIPLGMLGGLRSLLYEYQEQFDRQTKLIFHVAKDVEHIQILSRPPTYHTHRYRWNGCSLAKETDSKVSELEDGWYQSGTEYWRLDTLSDAQIVRLREREIREITLLSFVKDELPLYQAAGIAIECDLDYGEFTALELYIDDVERRKITLRRHWSVPLNEISQAVKLDEHILVNRTIHPGLLPSALNRILGSEDDALILSNMDIARFHDTQFPILKKWFVRGMDAFERVHSWINPPYEWILSAEIKQARGIGKAYAYPTACIGDGKYATDALRQMMSSPYTQLEDGWVRRADLCFLGMDHQGSLSEGAKLKPYRLTASQLLMRGGKRLHGPWKRMEIHGVPWNASSQKQQAAREHLAFLLYWGINGGLTGGYEAAIAYGAEALRGLMTLAPDCRILIVGAKADLDEYEKSASGLTFLPAAQYEEATSGRVYLLPHDKIGRTPTVQSIHWDLLLLIEPDELYKEMGTSIYQNVQKLNPECMIGFYLNPPASWTSGTLYAQNILLRIPTSDSITELCVRDPRAPRSLPKAYVFPGESIAPAKDVGVDVVLEGAVDAGISIPMRKTEASLKLVNLHDIRFNNSFFTDARRYVGVAEGVADHIPFSNYWPTYTDMTPGQRKWYFYLRTCLRHHETPDTDLSYLLIYIYELLNLIGCEKPEDAYHALLFVWKEYRIRHPQLDHYLSSWVFDFIHIHPCGITYWDFIANAPSIEEAALNCALTQRDNQPLLLSIQALEMLGGYRITHSKFYLAGYQELIEKVLPRVVALIDARLTDAYGQTLLEHAGETTAPIQESRDAFRSALIEVNRSYTLSFVPHTHSEPLRKLTSQVLRYAENVLRGQVSFSSKLRGITLDDRIQKWIDAYLAKQVEKRIEVSPRMMTNADNLQRPRVESNEVRGALIATLRAHLAKQVQKRKEVSPRIMISADNLQRLRVESNEVRSALIAAMEEEIKDVQEEIIEHPVLRPSHTPDGLLTDLTAVGQLLRALNDEDQRILSFLIEHDWEADISSVANSFPGMMIEANLDGLNEYALQYLRAPLIEREGNRVIVEEDYRDELEYLISHKPDDPSFASHWSIEDSDLDEDWKAFFGAVNRDALGSLLIGADELTRYSQEHGTMPDLLIDEINEQAMEYLGDLLIMGDAIVEDYIELVQTHMKRM